MTDLSLSKDFLSKENTTFLYKSIISKYELDNINKEAKEKILNSLFNVMKRRFKILDLNKINNANVQSIKKQFNELCITDSELGINNINKVNTIEHDRKFNRDFNTVKKTVTISERPVSGIDGNKDTKSYEKHLSINDRLKELEESRRNENPKKNLTIPDFLKQTKVGKAETNYETTSAKTEKTLLGYSNDTESNFTSVSRDSSNKYNETLSVQDRLKQLERDRQLPVGSQGSNQIEKSIQDSQVQNNYISSFNQSESNILDNQFNIQTSPRQETSQPRQDSIQQPRQETSQPRQESYQQPRQETSQPRQETSQPRQETYQPPRQESYQPPRQETSQPRQESYQQPRQETSQPLRQETYQAPRQETYQAPRQESYQQPRQESYQQPRQETYQPQQESIESQQLRESNITISKLLQVINDMKIEIENIKNVKKQFTKKSLQLEINKSDSTYNYIFNPIENITNISLVSYYLPNPLYNIIEDTIFSYILEQPKHINIKRGFYTIEKLIEVLNNNNDLIFSLDDTLKVKVESKSIESELPDSESPKFKIVHNYISTKLGFESLDEHTHIIANKFYDLRLPAKLNLYIHNLQDEPIGILNFNGTSICNLNFKYPISLNKLDIKFTTEDNIEYNFNGIFYNLSFIIDIVV